MIRMISAALVAFFLSGSSSFAQVTPAPGFSFEVELFDPDPLAAQIFPPSDAPSFTAFMYGIVFSGTASTFQSVDSSAVHTVISTLGIDNGQLEFGKGASADRLFLNEVGSPSAFPDGIYELSSSGTITLINDLGGGNPDPQVEAPPASWGDVLCISNPTAGAGALYNRRITLVDLDGSYVSTLLSSPDGPFWLAAPETSDGPYGDYLYFNLFLADGVYRVDSSGNTELFCAGVETQQLEFGHGGGFGDFLYAWQPGGRLLQIGPDGNSEVILTGLGGITSQFEFHPTTGDLYAHEPAGMVRVHEPDTGFQRADCNQDGGIDISDPIGILDQLFSGGDPSGCEKACDANDDGAGDIGDVIFTLGFLFDGGAPPPEPFGACGTDPTVDSLTCDSFAPCL